MRQFKFFLAAFLLLAVNAVAQNTYPPLVQTVTYAGLGTSANNGTIRYCRDCDATDPCAGGGSGAFALRVNGAWQCAAGGGSGVASTGGTGFVVETAPGVAAARTMTNTDGCITIQNGDGVSANPTINIDTTCVLTFTSGTGTASATGDLGTLYIETDTGIPTLYTNTDTIADLVTEQQDSIAGADWFIDEDSMATDSATRVPSQQSVKAYVDASGGGVSSGTTFFHVREEFMMGATTSLAVGEHGWNVGQLTSAGTVSTDPGQANHPGILRLTSGTTDNGGPSVGIGPATGAMVASDYSGEDWTMTYVIAPEDAVTSTLISVGLDVTGAIAATSAIRAFFDSDHAHATWIFQLCDSATTGCQSAGDDTNADTVASTHVPATGVWQAVEISHCNTCGPAGVEMYSFRVGSAGAFETAKTFCSSGCDSTMANEPTAAMTPKLALVARAASTNKDLFFDMFELIISSGLVRY